MILEFGIVRSRTTKFSLFWDLNLDVQIPMHAISMTMPWLTTALVFLPDALIHMLATSTLSPVAMTAVATTLAAQDLVVVM